MLCIKGSTIYVSIALFIHCISQISTDLRPNNVHEKDLIERKSDFKVESRLKRQGSNNQTVTTDATVELISSR